MNTATLNSPIIVDEASASQATERLLYQIVELAPSGIAVTDPSGRILLANAELERMFGYERAQLFALGVERLVPERFRVGHAELRAAGADDPQSRVLIRGRELYGRRADGIEFPIEIGMSLLSIAGRTMIVETVLDISARKQLERMFRKMVEAAPCGMVMVDARGRIVLVNPQAEAMFGYDKTELIGNGIEMLLPERSRVAHTGQRDAYIAAPSIHTIGAGRDFSARRKDGTEFPVEVGLNPVPGQDGGLVLAAITDITRRKRMELELKQANANLEEFAYAASHDLKSPLRGISDLTEWIIDDLGGEQKPQVTHNLGRVRERIRRLERVVDDLLAYARAGVAPVEVTPVEPRALVEDVLEIEPLPPGFRVSTRIEAQPFVTARTPLETVLRNLISNAVKHHDRPSGSIEIQVEDDAEYCLLTVTDDGPGIPVAAQERVFRMFQTLSPANSGNSGIGLALSKRLVESHGGKIMLESADGVRGTSFRVWWPRFQWRKTDD